MVEHLSFPDTVHHTPMKKITTHLVVGTGLAMLLSMPAVVRLRAQTNEAPTVGVAEARVEALKNQRFGMFICWSFSTFSGREWTPGVTNVELFGAKKCDTDQWARTAKEAGMGYILFPTKMNTNTKTNHYLLAEFTYPILPEHQGGAMWFYSLPKFDKLCLPAEKIYEDYLGAVKYGNVFSLDVGPDYNGRLRDIDVNTLRQVGRHIGGKDKPSGNAKAPTLFPG
jgi:hypothetical protein